VIDVIPYTPKDRTIWDAHVRRAKNGAFLFERDYMDYHADRFPDNSFLLHRDGKPVALLPACRIGNEVSSHAGLTFGGILSDEHMTTSLMLELFDALLKWLRVNGVRRFVYKRSPEFYHTLPADEDAYALFRHGFQLFRRDVGSLLCPSAHPEFRHGRRQSVKKSLKAGVVIRETADFSAYWRLLDETLQSRHAARPVHSVAEIQLLKQRFPENIRLFTAYDGAELLAGSVIFENRLVAHTQYIASSPLGREVGALDLILSELITRVFAHKTWFSFGTSTESNGTALNIGLIEHKEGFGARACVQDSYELNL